MVDTAVSIVETHLVALMRGGVILFRGSGADALRYLESDQVRADEYYLEAGTSVAIFAAVNARGRMLDEVALTAVEYRRWVDWLNPITDERMGRPRLPGEGRRGSPRFAEMVVNVPKNSFQNGRRAWRASRLEGLTLLVVIEELVPDGLWMRVQPLLPAAKPRPRLHHGRNRLDDRAALAGIVFVLKHGIGWANVPKDALGVSGVTCWRRLRDWTEAGVWPKLHEVLLAELRGQGLLNLDDMSVDGSHVRALKGGLRSAHPRSTAAMLAASTT